MQIINNLFDFFNWKKYPANVFCVTLPLFGLGMFLMGSLAYLHWKMEHDFWYTVIFMGGIGLLIFGLWPIRKQLIEIMKN